jgi:antitoxin ChpS
MKTTVRKVGNSLGSIIPAPVARELALEAGSEIEITIKGGKIIIEPISRPHYTLEELLAQCDSTADLSPEDRVWLDDGSCGNELL